MTKEYIKKNQFCSCIYINRDKKYPELSYGYTGFASCIQKTLRFHPKDQTKTFSVEEKDLYKPGVSEPQ